MRSLFLSLALVVAVPALAQPSFRGLGIEDGYSSSRFVGFSADGRVAAGNEFRSGANGQTIQAFFADGAGMHGVGWLPGTPSQTRAVGLDADGSHLYVTAVRGEIGAGGEFTVGRATAGGGLEDLGAIAGADGLYGRAVAGGAGAYYVQASHDGGDAPSTAYRWTEAEGYVALAGTPSGSFEVSAASEDASGMAGLLDGRPMRWDGSAWSSLPSPAGTTAAIGGVTDRGAVVAGTTFAANGTSVATLWDHATAQTLGDLAGGGDHGQALGLTADGSLVVGTGTETYLQYEPWRNGYIDVGQSAAWIWSKSGGMEKMSSFLEDAGLDLGDWTLTSATSIVSHDGLLTIGGDGVDPLGRTQGWIATLDSPLSTAVPEPTGLAVFGLGGLAFLRRRAVIIKR